LLDFKQTLSEFIPLLANLNNANVYLNPVFTLHFITSINIVNANIDISDN